MALEKNDSFEEGEEEKESEVEESYMEEARVYELMAERRQDTRLEAYVNYTSMEEATDSHWARGCSETDVELVGVNGTIRALLDSVAEVNLMTKEVYDKGKWAVDCDIKWNLNSINAMRNVLWGACPDIKIKIGNVIEPINIFVHNNLPYPLILGQPFITESRMETKVLDDVTHVAKIKSRDNVRMIQFATVCPGNHRNRRELRALEPVQVPDEEEDFQGASW
ncbi:unnamed protein product [Calypogeia fissa]